MKLPLSWLLEHAPLTAGVDDIAEALVRLGHEVEGVETPRAAVRGVKVGHILSKDKHPDADKLSLLKVDVGDKEPLAIVCGASNMEAGDKVPVATVGTSLPNGLVIKKGKIRGQESFGMCCSATELGLPDESAGLLILPGDAPVGAEMGELLALEEAVFDVSITPNRGDCMSVLGLARDLAADAGIDLQPVQQPAVAEVAGIAMPKVTVSAGENCPQYLARRIEGIKVQASPDWMQQRLMMAGMRPVNGVVDVLNFIMLDMGQPMHAFDADTLRGDITVRDALGGEDFAALDGRKLKLAAGDLVIADSQSVIALGGIMGSQDSGVTESTVNIMLESAYFKPARISLSRRMHGMVSEASMRFERGVDPAQVALAMDRATAMIVELFDGTTGAVVQAGDEAKLPTSRQLRIERKRIESRLGITIPESTDDVLARMGFGMQREGAAIIVDVPSHRHDVSIPEDMSEEYARIIGFDAIPEIMPSLAATQPSKPDNRLRIAVQGGATQVINYAFISKEEQRLFTADVEGDVCLANPISESMAVMRRSLFPSLLNVAKYNLNRQQAGVFLVEQGRTYTGSAKGHLESDRMCWLMTGALGQDEWFAKSRLADFFDLKGAVESWLARLGLTARFIANDDVQGLQAGQTATILVGRSAVGLIGKVDASIAESFDLDGTVLVADIDLAALPAAKQPKFSPLPEYPSIERDLVFLFGSDATAEDILKAVRKAGGQLVTEARIFDRYDGKGVLEGKVSLGVRYSMQAVDRTLTQDDADKAMQAIIAAMQKQFAAELRG